MIIKIKHLNALDVISVLLFSLLANYVLPLKIDFQSSLDYVEIIKLTLLTTSSIVFYTVVTKLKDIASYSRGEYDAETSLEEQARRSIEDRYCDYYRREWMWITISILIAIACSVLFFLLQPIIDVWH